MGFIVVAVRAQQGLGSVEGPVYGRVIGGRDEARSLG
eukprot:CAMPEP_0197590540 /NCGR_PEP_ID=MMETSP1326-20131121/11471_1 /TAXON_ID=1155430 /ORGANISM="Genus nov. species nov., Strain RCC2288" /LENGTH=36 /DNA_ID= /DNA_START= /DNA_END= /DNA_ORIENTATION=